MVVVVVPVSPACNSGKALAGFGIANVLCLPTESDWISKSKSTPMILEEGIVDRDEPDFDRHLKVLEPAKLAEQVGDLVVNFGRVLDDQADAEEERDDRTRLPLLIEAAACIAAEAAAQAIG